MMELTCAFILLSASLVLATPHGYGGYGVKGGASARAESSASAGDFVPIPVAVPLGAGYSGSFSKSSSSSSASSSASSSSFSFGGSGAGGFGIYGGAPGIGGCSSGSCQNGGENGIQTPHGSSAQGYNSANAATSAQAGAVSGLGCQGSSCGGNSEKCTSGQCGSASINGASSTDDDSNDIRAVSAHNANHQSGIDATSATHNSADSNCFNGKCGPSSLKPNHYGHESGNSAASNNLQGSTSNIAVTSHYQKPSTHLETPNESSKCISGHCNTGLGEPGYGSSPSSYNVPIHGTYNVKPSCDGVKCENQPNGPYSPTDNSVTKGPSSFDYPSSTNCVGSSCFGSPANHVTGGPSGTVKPGNNNFGHSPSHVPSNVAPGQIGNGKPSDANNKLPNDKLPPYTGGFGGPAGVLNPNDVPVFAKPNANAPQNGKPFGSTPAGCNSPSCSGYPSPSGPTGGLAPTGTYSRPGGDIPSDKLPPYTGGFGGPPGTLTPGGFDVHATVTNKPTYTGSPSYNTQPVGNIGTPGCKAGQNCGGYSVTAGSRSGATAPSGHYGTTKPSHGIYSPNDKLPSYTSGFGAPVGVLNPDKNGIHATGPSSPGYTPSGTYNTPTPSSFPSFGSTAATESFGVTKLGSGPYLSSVTQPAYTSSYNTPSGVHRPNEISGPASTPSFTYTQSPLSPGSYSPDCRTGNCDKYPTSGPSASAPNQPQYTGGIVGPTGTFKPDEYNLPGCKSGNCASNSQSGPSAGANTQYTGGFGGPSGTFQPDKHNSPGCKSGNCGSYPTSGPSAGANVQSGSFGVTGTGPNTGVNSAAPNQPQYTSGFGGPSGTYKPDEHNSSGCKSGNCGSNPTSGPSAGANTQYTGGFGGPSGTFQPDKHTSPGCKSGNCGSYPTSGPSAGANVQPGAFSVTGINTGGFTGSSGTQIGSYGVTKPSFGNNPSDEKPTYNGGFGGAPGLLKPNEFTIPAVTLTPLNKATGISTPTACISGNCNSQAPHSSAPHAHHGAPSGAQATAAATAEANAVAYTGGFGGPPGVLTPFDDGKIGTLPTSGAQGRGLQVGGVHGSHNAKIHSPHGVIPGASGSSTGPAGTHGNTGAQTGSAAGATAYAGAAAGASAGGHGSNPHGSYNHAGNVKGGSPCGVGCGGSGSSTYNGGSTLDISGGQGFPKLLSDGLNGAGSTSGATARSLSGANAFGSGDSFASSSASSHASAGAYTKGGYGKR